MDLKFWIWLLVIVVTLIARATKKKSPPAQAEKPANPNADREFGPPSYEEQSRPQTFEELLREIQSSKIPKPEVRHVPAAQTAYDSEVQAKSDRNVLEDTGYDYRKHDVIYDIYDNAKKEAFVRPSLEETLKLEDTIIRFNPFKGYQAVEQRNYAAELAKEIQNPSGFKKAFIMSEILQRRF